MMNLFENLQMIKESNNVKTEGIFGNKKKKEEQYEKEIKKVFDENSTAIANKIASRIYYIIYGAYESDEYGNAKQQALKVLKVAGNEIKRYPQKLIRDTISLGDDCNIPESDELKEYYDKIKQIRNVEKIGLEIEKYLYTKIAPQLMNKIEVLKKTKIESAILKDEKDIEQVVESTTLRPFDSRDHAGWGGVHDFADGSSPMIVDGEFATILVGQSDEEVGTESATVSIYYGDPEADAPQWAFKGYNDKESAIKDAKFFAKLADEEIDESQLERFGFTIV